MYVCICMYVCMNVCIYVHIYIYMFMYKYTCMCKRRMQDLCSCICWYTMYRYAIVPVQH